MFRKPAAMRDDRELMVPLFNPAGSSWPSPSDPRARKMYDKLATLIVAGRKRRWIPALIYAASMLFLLAVSPRLIGRRPTAIESFVLVMVLAIGYGTIAARAMRRKIGAMGPSLADVVLEEGLCPSCSYQLGTTPPDPDGCIACPECGAAWRAERVKSAAPFDSAITGKDRLRAVGAAFVGESDVRLVKDDRERQFRLIHPWMRTALRHATPEHRQTLRRARRRVLRNRLWLRLPLALLFLACGIGFPILIMNARIGAAMNVAMTAAIFVPSIGMLGFAAAIFFGNFGFSKRRIQAIMRESRSCPSCGGALGSKAADEDGCTVCTGCGAAWKLSSP